MVVETVVLLRRLHVPVFTSTAAAGRTWPG
jgi:hypothetical protein